MKLAKFVIKINYPFALLGGGHVELCKAVGGNSEKDILLRRDIVQNIL